MHDKHNNNIINLLFQSYLVTPLFKIVKKDVKLQKKDHAASIRAHGGTKKHRQKILRESSVEEFSLPWK